MTLTAYEPDGFPFGPIVGPGIHVPLAHDPPSFIATPDIQRQGPGPRLLKRTYGGNWLPWTARPVNPVLLSHKRVTPASDPERLAYWDVSRCIDVDPAVLSPVGVAFDLVRKHLQKNGAGVVQRLATMFPSVVALDGGGLPIFNFGNLDGSNPCPFPLQHPDPAGGTLDVQFRLVATHVPNYTDAPGAGFPAMLVAAAPQAAPTDELIIAPWNDLRQGYLTRWADELQYITGQNVLVRLIAIYFALPNRWRLRVGGRLSGFWSPVGRRGAALHHAISRLQ